MIPSNSPFVRQKSLPGAPEEPPLLVSPAPSGRPATPSLPLVSCLVRPALVASVLAISVVQLNGCGGGGGAGKATAAATEAEIATDSTRIAAVSSIPQCQTDCVDKFGVQMIYPSKPGGESWAFSNLNDPRVGKWGGVNVSMNSDGSIKARSINNPAQVRINIFTSTWNGNDSALETDQRRLEQRGYMFDQNDWRNVEMTGFVRLISGSGDDFTWYARGARHTSNGCWGTALKNSLSDTGEVRIQKELHHTNGYTSKPWRSAGTGPLKNQWVGFKAVMYNKNLNGAAASVQELYINDGTASGVWRKVYEYTDSGGWSTGAHCGGKSDQVISWGGPIATFRWDKFAEVDMKYLSVREIDVSAALAPGSAPSDPPPPDTTGGPGPVEPVVCGSIIVPAAATASAAGSTTTASHAIDSDLGTRWSAHGLPQSIALDLGTVKRLCSAQVSWYRGADRLVTFDVDTSILGSTYTTQLAGIRNKGTTGLEEYLFDEPVFARYLRIRVLTNTENNWASIKEIRAGIMSGTAPESGSPQHSPSACSRVVTGRAAAASSFDSPTPPRNAIDGNLETRWAAQPLAQEITIDLGDLTPLCAARIAWYRGDSRRLTFDVATSIDGASFSSALEGVQNKGTTELEDYPFSAAVSARYLRIRVTDNSSNNWASINEAQGLTIQ